MAEREVAPAAMDVELLAEVPHRHRRALDVPTRTSTTKPRRPCRFTRSGRPPQRKVQRIPLRARAHRAQQRLLFQLANHRKPRSMRKLTVAGKPTYVEIQRVGLIRIPARMELRRSAKDRLDLLGDP